MICRLLAEKDGVEGAGELGVAIADEESESLPGVVEVHGEVARQLGQPRASRVRGDTEDVHAAGGVLIRPHQLRHAFASNVADSGGGIDVVADLLGHASVSASQVYSHPDPSRLRAAVDAVPSPREQAGVAR